MTNYEKLGFDEIVRWLARVKCKNCLAQKYCYKRLPEDKFIPCDETIKEYLELDSVKGAEYFLTFKDIDCKEDDEEDDDFSELTLKAIHIGKEEAKSELWVESL